MIDTAARKISVYIKQQVPEHPSSVEVLEYSIGMFLNIAAIIIGSLGVSYLTGNTTEIIIILISFSLLRQVSGGIHLKTGTACAVVSITLFTLISFFNTDRDTLIHAITVITLLIVLIYAPSNFEKQHNVPKKFYPLLKLISFIMVMTNFVFVSDALAISFFIQSITLIIGREVKRYGSNSKA
ncbi:hypothetical protein BK126_04305 [Paenibacillus sp. FSL H7-0326]|uniref:accessory gene regulator ArgB-like protein n=1 Tax=Paenibacillus sp. FSL H7-0326 TaxID=1921144 RepID=UPI000970204D|nr:accessory gene regulator B family protein [Paenibacillus sp. FSL H7-0326]OMC71325.1 hypothetical protein BK126_04305 [Paenibacillus sp. FSL H7-0326]